MALLDILCFPDARLRTKAKLIDEVTDELRGFIDDMSCLPGVFGVAHKIWFYNHLLLKKMKTLIW